LTLQRKRGQLVTVYPAVASTDTRGHRVWVPDVDSPVQIRATMRPERSYGMEIPGQNLVRQVLMVCDLDAPVAMFARLHWDGVWWDVAAPPDKRFGPRATAHMTVQLRERTNG
jgi:hypothetical protein